MTTLMMDSEIKQQMEEAKLSIAQQFIDCVKYGVSSFQKAGDLLVAGLAANPCLKEEIMELCPEFSMEVLNHFELIGRKQLCPQLLVSEAPGVRALRRMPISDQQRYLKEPIDLLVVNDQDHTSHIKAMVYNFTTEQTMQVFAKTHIRDQAGQRTWVENRKAKLSPKKSLDTDYVVRRQEVIINRPCVLTRNDLIRLLAETSN